ncbi:hypothetical protein ACOI1H_13735 [Loktanella sp. DJP18]|uniref:hypothetical protein n=1 Tax=Loktanella sp. DJP18 TaxID=3409788 RepID=UPI003BB69D94
MNKVMNDGTAAFAALDARDFFRRHGNTLAEVLDAIAGNRGVDLYCEADRLLDSLSPDPVRVGRAVRKMRDLLAAAPTPEDRHAASLRWHGARLNDLVSALPQ